MAIAVALLCAVAPAGAQGLVAAQPAQHGALLPEQLAIIVNDAEPDSVAIGEFYAQARAIPPQNTVHVTIPNRPHKLSSADFAILKQQIDAKLGPQIEAVVMLWTAPYAVECNSITAAFTYGFNAAQCDKPCGPGKPSPYFNSPSSQPYKDFGMRLSMLMPIESVAQAKALIAHGTSSGFRVPNASAYYLITSELARNSRAIFFPPSVHLADKKLTTKTLRADSLDGAQDVMIYQTGMARVDKLDTLRFLPGALADHLTSTGGDLLSNDQMSSLRWLDAGATASYGSVSEPCNHWQKFPHPSVLLNHYLLGETAIEAYWKSVAWPSQGLFIGEPLAAPYRH